MSTIYTLNGKALKNTATDKWLIKAPPVPTFDEVTIGTQTWMSKNLAIDDGQGGIYTQIVNYGQGDVVEYYYTWDAAVRVAAAVAGWHLPTENEWLTLREAAGGFLAAGTKLKSTYGWNNDGNGTDDYGFTVLPAGRYDSSSFTLKGEYAPFWTATEYSSSAAYYRYFNTGTRANSNYNGDKLYGYSVRLVKDAT